MLVHDVMYQHAVDEIELYDNRSTIGCRLVLQAQTDSYL